MRVSGISTDKIGTIIANLRLADWATEYEYDGFDAWIDYGEIVFRKGETRICVEWDNWFEGIIDAPEEIVKKLLSAE